MSLQAPLTLMMMHITGYAFVDDTNLVQTQGNIKTEEELLVQAQAQLIVWEELLCTTGGAIAPEKSHWVFVRYHWKNDRWNYKKEKYQEQLKVQDKHKLQLPLTQLDVYKARETLGVWFAADRNWETQMDKLEDKALQWAIKLQQGHLNEADTAVALQTMVTKSLMYALPQFFVVR